MNDLVLHAGLLKTSPKCVCFALTVSLIMEQISPMALLFQFSCDILLYLKLCEVLTMLTAADTQVLVCLFI